MELIEKLMDIEFWLTLVENFKALGPIGPIFLALIESLIPALPLIAIVTFNVGVYGGILGFAYSWIGTTIGSFLVFFVSRTYFKKWLYPHMMKHKLIKRIMNWITQTSGIELFLLTCVAFTPSSLINISYGLSGFGARKFYSTLLISKLVMIAVLAIFGNSISMATQNPFYLLLAIAILLALIVATSKIKKHTKFDTVEKEAK